MSHSKAPRFVTAALLAALAPLAARAADRCGGVKLDSGHARLGKPLTVAFIKTPDGQGCLADLVKALEGNRLVRAVTVAALVPDAERANGAGLADARTIAAALVTAGLPQNRVFALAPAPKRTDELGLWVRYVERAPEDVLARIAASGGPVFLGPDEGALKPAEPGMPVMVNELVKTGLNAHASIHLRDGSGIEIKPESVIKLAVLQFPEGGDRHVKIDVLSGGVLVDVRKATQLSRFEASSRVAVASVRGTVFRFATDEAGGARLETLEGVVAMGSATDPAIRPVEVPAGQGTVVSAEGKVSPPTVLPEAPRVIGPLKGPLGAEARFEWQAVANAASYRVETSRDADFFLDPAAATVAATTLSWPEPLAKGKWFWRVTGLDGHGFAGPSSKVYAFTVGKEPVVAPAGAARPGR